MFCSALLILAAGFVFAEQEVTGREKPAEPLAEIAMKGESGKDQAEAEKAGGIQQSDILSEYLSFSVQAQLLVINREAAAEALVEWVEEKNGYFTEKSLNALVLRVPVDVFADLREEVRLQADEVVAYTVQAYDLRQELSSIQAALAGREESLKRVLVFIDSADVAGTLSLEREIASLMREIESLKGRERVLRNRMAYAEAYISLSTVGTSIPVKRPSSFAWINSIDLYSFLEEQPE